MLTIAFPEPAHSLYGRTHDLLDRWLPTVLPNEGVWAIGGGTVLAALWEHRKSTDLDIFIPSECSLSAISPGWSPEFADSMADRGASAARVQSRGLKFQFDSGRVELTALDPNPPILPTAVSIDGYTRHILPPACILTGKLAGRGVRLPPRDIFDIGVAAWEAPDALACAVNHLEHQTRAEITARMIEGADAYRASAPEVILDPGARWSHLIEEGPEAAVDAIAGGVYREVRIDFDRGRARVSVANDSQGETSHTFDSPEALVDGLTGLGLRPRTIAQHGKIERFLRTVAGKFSAPGFDL